MNIIEKLKRKILPDKVSKKEKEDEIMKKDCNDYLISMGVLLWVVAEADDKFLPEEKRTIKKVLKSCSQVTDEDMSVVIRAIEEAALFRIDLYSFTKEIENNLKYNEKVNIIENLFRVACSDNELSNDEVEMIRKIAGLIQVEHKEFIDAKIKIKKEFGMDTAGL